MVTVHRFPGVPCACVDVVHRRNIVHRDIKPDNVLVSQNEGAKLADLGVAHFFDNSDSDMLTKTEGTLFFFAPECCRGS